MRWVGQVQQSQKERDQWEDLDRGWKIIYISRKIEWDSMEWIHLVQDTDQCRLF
jgi:hypothetical protein